MATWQPDPSFYQSPREAAKAPAETLAYVAAFDPARKAPRLFAPIQASIAELIIVWAWHTPALHHAARQHTPVFIAEQGMFFVAGVLLWASAFGGNKLDSRSRSAAGVVGLLLTAMHMTLLGALLALAPRPLYAHAGDINGLTGLDDQHFGGAIMLVVGGVSYLIGGLLLTLRLLREPLAAPLGRP